MVDLNTSSMNKILGSGGGMHSNSVAVHSLMLEIGELSWFCLAAKAGCSPCVQIVLLLTCNFLQVVQ